MRYVFAFILTAVLMTACGNVPSTAPPSGDASMAMEDRGNATPDVVSNKDAPTPVEVVATDGGQPIVISDAGTDVPFLCGPQLCDMPLMLVYIDAPGAEVVPRCNAARTRLDFSTVMLGGGWADCAGNRCARSDQTAANCVTSLVFRMAGSTCTNIADVILTCDGQPVSRSSGAVRLEPRI